MGIDLEEVERRRAEYVKMREMMKDDKKKETILRNLRIISVVGEQKIGKNGRPYDVMVISYWGRDGQEEIKTVPMFTDEGKRIIDVIEEDASYEVRMNKIKGRWTWMKMTRF